MNQNWNFKRDFRGKSETKNLPWEGYRNFWNNTFWVWCWFSHVVTFCHNALIYYIVRHCTSIEQNTLLFVARSWVSFWISSGSL